MVLNIARYAGLLVVMLAPVQALAVPAIQHWETQNGARVYFTSAREIPMVDVRIVFDAGSARDRSKPGLAMLTNGLLMEGTGKLDANAISEALDGIGAQTGSGALRDMAWLNVRTLSEEKVLQQTMDIMAKVVSDPAFPKESFEREKKRMLVTIRAGKQKPSEIAERAFMKAVYGEHPYATAPNGNENSVPAISLQDIKDFYKQYYGAKNAVIAIVGDLSRSRAESLAEDLSKGLKPGAKADALPEVNEIKKANTVHIKHPSTQTHVWVGQPGVARGDPDYFALYVGNHTLGGSGLVSLLNNEVRQKRGYAYSVYSYFSPMRKAGPYEMSLQTKNQHAQDALKVMRETAEHFIRDGISDEQIKASKQNITGGFALRLDSNKKLAQYLAMIGFYGLPLDYLETFNSKIESVTAAQVSEAFRRRIRPDRLITVIVGPGEAKQGNKEASLSSAGK